MYRAAVYLLYCLYASPLTHQDEYRGSAEERRDIFQLYERHSGSMGHVFEWLMCSEPEVDSHRFMDMLQAAIAAGAE